MLHDVFQGMPPDSDQAVPASSEQLARQQAIRQIERRRHFWIRATTGTVLMIIVAVIWGFSEYHNAGGWPTSGFSQSSAIPHVWNYWIIYPAIVWVLLTAGDAWHVFGSKPISEAEIKREIERQSDRH
jgi:H+/Cl- antiporter ClcA